MLCIIKTETNESKERNEMQIKITDKSRNGEVIVRNFNAQRRVERQLDEILARIRETNAKLRAAQ